MSSNAVNAYLMSVSTKLPAHAVPMLRDRLEFLPEDRLMNLYAVELRDPMIVLLISIFLCGVDRIFIGQLGLGLLKLFTAGACGIWWLIDLFLITDATKQYNLNKLNEALLMLE